MSYATPLGDGSSDACFALFAKYWEAGSVKTRLASQIGAQQAGQLYYELLAATLARMSAVAAYRVVAYTPADRRDAFARLAPQWDQIPQQNGDLGKRLGDFFNQQFQAGRKRVVVIGADSPHLPPAHIEAAYTALQNNDVVLGPTEDGGYYLVGARGSTPPIFADVAWGTPAVWGQTTARLHRAGLAYEVLPRWYDIDRAEDVDRLARDLAAANDLDAPLERLLERLQAIRSQ